MKLSRLFVMGAGVWLLWVNVSCAQDMSLILHDLELCRNNVGSMVAIQSDRSGNIHMLYAAVIERRSGNHVGLAQAARYVRYNANGTERTVDSVFWISPTLDPGPRIFVNDSGDAFCVFSPTLAGTKGIYIFDSSGKLVKVEKIGGHYIYDKGSLLPDGRYLFQASKQDREFGIVDTRGSIKWICDERRYRALRRELPFHGCRIGAFLALSPDELFEAVYTDPHPRHGASGACGAGLGFHLLDLKNVRALKSQRYLLGDSGVVETTDLPFEKTIHVFAGHAGEFEVYLGCWSGEETPRLCYTTVDKDLNLVAQKPKSVVQSANVLSPSDPKVEHQFFWFERSGQPEFVGTLWSIAVTADTLYWWRSEPIRSRAREQYEK